MTTKTDGRGCAMIVKEGHDVTEQVFARVAVQQEGERLRTNMFRNAAIYLIKAKMELDNLPRPWQNDCIYRSVQAIEAIMADLRGTS